MLCVMEMSCGCPVVVEESLIADGGAVNRIIGGKRKLFSRAVLVEKLGLLAKMLIIYQVIPPSQHFCRILFGYRHRNTVAESFLGKAAKYINEAARRIAGACIWRNER